MNHETIDGAVPARAQEPVWLEPRELAVVYVVLSVLLLGGLLVALAVVVDVLGGASAYD